MSVFAIAALFTASFVGLPADIEPLQNGSELAQQTQAAFEAFGESEAAEGRQLSRESVAVWAQAALGEIDVTKMTPSQVSELSMLIELVPGKMDALRSHLKAGAKGTGPDALQASAMLVRLERARPDEARIHALLQHPALQEAVEQGQAIELLEVLSYAPAETLAAHRDELANIATRLITTGDDDHAVAAARLIEALSSEPVGMPAEQRLAMMDEAVRALRAAAKQTSDKRLQARMTGMADYLGGAAARGELIGHDAPPIQFVWVSADQPLTSLKDLKGKVVVLDFWATWCGPCIGSFPDVAALQERYRDHDVAIIGVTSVQGTHYPGDGAPVDVEGQPEREFELMRAFMEDKGVSWTVAFSEQDVFNPDFGVRGIPHVAILDTEGRVVENGLHPGGDPAHKHDLIDSLLHKAGRSAPPGEHAHDHDHDHDHDHAHDHDHDHDGDGHPDH